MTNTPLTDSAGWSDNERSVDRDPWAAEQEEEPLTEGYQAGKRDGTLGGVIVGAIIGAAIVILGIML